MLLRNRLLDRMRGGFGTDPPPLRLVFPDHVSFDFTPNPAVTIIFHSAKPLKALLRGDFAGAADAYVAGQIAVEGPIETVLNVGISLAEKLGQAPHFRRLAHMVRLAGPARSLTCSPQLSSV